MPPSVGEETEGVDLLVEAPLGHGRVGGVDEMGCCGLEVFEAFLGDFI